MIKLSAANCGYSEVRRSNTTGDGFVAPFDGPARASRCGQVIVDATRALDIELRMGLHTGECEFRGNDLGGLAVHIVARIGSLASPNEVLVSSTVKDLVVGSGIEFQDRGNYELRGVPGSWHLFHVKTDLIALPHPRLAVAQLGAFTVQGC